MAFPTERTALCFTILIIHNLSKESFFLQKTKSKKFYKKAAHLPGCFVIHYERSDTGHAHGSGGTVRQDIPLLSEKQMGWLKVYHIFQ